MVVAALSQSFTLLTPKASNFSDITAQEKPPRTGPTPTPAVPPWRYPKTFFCGTAARPRRPGLLGNPEAAVTVHYLLLAYQRQAGGNAGEADGGDIGEVGAGGESLIASGAIMLKKRG